MYSLVCLSSCEEVQFLIKFLKAASFTYIVKDEVINDSADG